MLTFEPVDTELNGKAFLQFVKYNRPDIISKSRAMMVGIEDATRCKNNFYRYLRESGQVSERLHEVTLILNGLKSTRDFGPHVKHVIIPDESYVMRLLSNHKSTYPKELV